MNILPFEHEDLAEYDAAHRLGQHEDTFCASEYPDCYLSLIEFALGTYLIKKRTWNLDLVVDFEVWKQN